MKKEFFLIIIFFMSINVVLFTQQIGVNNNLVQYNLSSGIHNSSHITTKTESFNRIISIEDASWLRLKFNNINLGRNSYVLIQSLKDNSTQKLDSRTIEDWGNTSAYFNGNSVKVTLIVGTGDSDIFFNMNEIFVGKSNQNSVPNNPLSIEDLCGSDDRELSDDKAVGRIITEPSGTYGTGFIIFNGRIITAGHVVRAISTTEYSVIEFNVPLSNSDGSINHPAAIDQYSFKRSYIVDKHDNGEGDDWAVFYVNTNNGLGPKERQNASFYLEQNNSFQTARVTGFGVDDGTYNRAQQKSFGQNQNSSGNIVKYNADTRADNSGSPVINESTDNVVGIHTNGHCASSGYNSGTSFLNPSLWSICNPLTNLTLHQKRENGTELTDTSYIGRWQGDYSTGNFQNYTIGSQGALVENLIYGNTEIFRAKQELTWVNSIEKYNNWTNYNDITNHRSFLIEYGLTELVAQHKKTFNDVIIKNNFPEVPNLNPSDDLIEFKDPWLIDYEDPFLNGTNYRNRGMQSSIFKSRNSPFSPNLLSFYGADRYQGVFLDQTVQGGNYYNVRSPIQQLQDIYISQTGKYHKFYFGYWSSTGTDPLIQNNILNGYYESPVVFRSGNATVSANLKGTQLANSNAYGNNSQRKIVRSDDGKLHMTYESMGYVWYERSTNGGTTWQIMNSGKPIDSNPGKAPSIEVLYQPENYQSEIYIVYQTYTSSTYDVAAIKVAYFLENQLQYINTVYVDDYYYRDYTSVNFNPVVAKMLAGRIMVAWEDYNIYYKIGNQISGGFSWGSTTSADNASGEKKFPTISSYRANPNGVFHLAWQNSYSTINYRSFTLQSNGTFIASSVENVSQGCGYPTNYAPSINVSSSNQVSLVWIGTPYYGTTTRKTISRTRTTAWSSTFGQYGDKVLSPNSAFYNGGNIIAWSENPSGSIYTNKFLKYGSVKTAGTTGRDIQIFNADNLTNMFISSFNSNAIPYYFSQSANLNSINKENSIEMGSGVQAVAVNGETEYYFRVGDVSVNGEAIDFIEFEPQYGTLSLNQLNNALLTNPFNIDRNSSINFSVEYGVTDSVSALNQLSNNKFITFKLELIDYLTKEVLKEVGKFTLDKKRLITLLSNSYSYSISGLNGRQLSIRIKIVHNLNPLYASAVIKSDAAVLPKANLINLSSLASELVTTYSLEQNYPNPFNPITKINWQAPISGYQILKVFDMLGNEIATLVDEWRDAGKYSHEFDASNLPSGVYVYQLRVNDFTASKKLLLLK